MSSALLLSELSVSFDIFFPPHLLPLLSPIPVIGKLPRIFFPSHLLPLLFHILVTDEPSRVFFPSHLLPLLSPILVISKPPRVFFLHIFFLCSLLSLLLVNHPESSSLVALSYLTVFALSYLVTGKPPGDTPCSRPVSS